MRLGTFLIGRVGAVISNEWVSHGHDLPTIGWVGQHFLITGHGSVETHFAEARAGRAEGFTLENSAIFEGEQCAHWSEWLARLCNPVELVLMLVIVIEIERRRCEHDYEHEHEKTRIETSIRVLKKLPRRC